MTLFKDMFRFQYGEARSVTIIRELEATAGVELSNALAELYRCANGGVLNKEFFKSKYRLHPVWVYEILTLEEIIQDVEYRKNLPDFPANFVCFARDGFGNEVGYLAGSAAQPVYYWETDAQRFTLIADSVREFLEGLEFEQ